MFEVLSFMFPKMFFSLDDLNGGGGEPEGQPAAAEEGNANEGETEGAEAEPATNDFVEFEGVKVPQEAFDKIAKEKYKDAFEAYENKSKWQAENTRRAQEIKQIERDAEAFRRLQAEQAKSQPRNEYEANKQSYVEKKKQAFPEVDPRFFESQFDDMWELSGRRAQESLSPLLEKQSQEWEQRFLQDHPLVKPNTDEYFKLAEYLKRGYEPEDAYQIVYKKELMDQEISARQKAADAVRLKKLKSTPTGSQDGEKPFTGSRSERIWRAMEKHGVSRDS